MKGFGRALFKKDKKDKKHKKRSSSDYNLDDIPSASLSALMNTATSGTIAAAVQSKGNDTTSSNTNTATHTTTLGSTASAFDPNYNRNMNYTPSVGGPSDNLSTSTSVTTVNVVRRASVRQQQQQLQQQQQQQQHHERTMLSRDHVTNESKLRVQRDQIQMDKMLDLKRRLKFMKHNTDEDDNEMLSARSKRTSIGQLTQPTTDDARISDVKQSPPKKAKSSLTEEVEKWSSFDQQGSNEDYGVWFSKLCLSQLYSDEMFESFYELKLLSRQLNVQLPVPEFVVIGKRGHGKSALIESLIGYSVNYVNSENVSLIEESNTLAPTTIRPVIIQLVYNDRYRAEPRCTVYYYEQQLVGGNGKMNTDDLDSLAQQEGMEGGAEEETDNTFQYDRQRIRQTKVSSGDLTVSEVSSEIEALCKRLNSSKELTNQNRDPIYLQMEYAYFFDMTIVDTPGIVKEYQTSSSNSDRHDAESEVDGESSVRSWNDIVNEYVAPSHRHIIAVEEASEWADIDIINFVKKFDPALTRSTFVFTKFHSLIKALSNDELQRFLQLTPKMNQFFFVSLFGARLRNAVHKERDQYDRTVLHAYIRDRRMLNQLRYDTIYSESMGIFKFRAHIFHKAYLNYHANIPEVLSCIRSSIRAREQQLNILNQAALAQRKIRDDQTTIALRRIATEYTTSFLRILRDLLNGTSFGHPNETGQSLMDEIEHGVGPWLDSNYNQIDIPRGDDLQFTEENLYGGQQMRRLLHEYEKICDALKLGDLTYDDIGSAAGLSSGSNTAGLYWASSEVVHNRLIPEMKSFLQQLIHRASFIVKRLPALVDRIMNEIARQPLLRGSARGAALDMERYVYFKSYISELFEEFVDIVAKVAHNKCLSEFYETKTIYWSAQLELRGIQVDFSNIEQSLMDISSRLFTLTKDRMVKGIVMKTYSFFVNPIQSDLWGFIHSRLSGLSDVQLEQIFELEAVKNSLASDRAKLKLDLENQYVQESSFVKFSTIFTKAFQVVNQDRLSISLKQASNSNKYRYDLRGLETDRWTDEKLNFEEQQKQLQASLELNKMSLQRRQSTRRATILARSPARAEDAKMTISTEPVRDTLESERVSTFDTEDDIDSDSDSDAEDLCDENLDLIIDRLDKADPSFTKLDLRSVTQKLKMVSIYQIQDFAAALGENQYLKVVDLSDSGVSNSVLNMIALLLKDNSVVESLDLSKNEIDDGAVQSLCKLIETSNSLTSLNLDKTYIQSAGFETLYHAISKNNKRHLKISLNQFASEQTREKFGRLR